MFRKVLIHCVLPLVTFDGYRYTTRFFLEFRDSMADRIMKHKACDGDIWACNSTNTITNLIRNLIWQAQSSNNQY